MGVAAIGFWQEHECGNPARLSPLSLAFVGDAVYEVFVRERILAQGNRPVNGLHREAVQFVCAGAQSLAYEALEEVLDEREMQILKRGRNSSSVRPPKSSSAIEYRRATAVEALMGYLYLNGEKERLEQLMEVCFKTIALHMRSGEKGEGTVG